MVSERGRLSSAGKDPHSSIWY